MSRLRKFVAYRRIERAYTRVSKYRKKAFIRMDPHPHIVRFDMGNTLAKFPYVVQLRAKHSLQIRDNALESARTSCNKILEEKAGKNNYRFIIRTYPFHVLRENPLAAGAGADRLSTGMSHSFGKPIGLAAQISHGQPLFEVRVNKEHVEIAKDALKCASYKLPLNYLIVAQKKDRKETAKVPVIRRTKVIAEAIAVTA